MQAPNQWPSLTSFPFPSRGAVSPPAATSRAFKIKENHQFFCTFPWGVNLKFHHDAIQKSVLWPTIVTGREKAAVSYTFNSILGVFTRKNRFIFFWGGGIDELLCRLKTECRCNPTRSHRRNTDEPLRLMSE